MSKVIKIKRGLDIKLVGSAQKELTELPKSKFYAIKPSDFPGVTPKVITKVGEEVKAGTPLFYDKYNPEVMFTSPVSGKLSEIVRGERRRILEFVVETNDKDEYETFKQADPKGLSREEIKENILKSGAWAFIRQRPFAIIAKPSETPRDIFITSFDSAPLAANIDFVVKDDFDAFQTGVDALVKLTDGKVYLGIKAEELTTPFKNTKNVEITEFKGPHPAGNVGIQINKVKPVNKGEVVWTLSAADVIIIGRLFKTGKFDAKRIIALAGSEVKNPQYYQALLGAPIADFVKDNLKTTDGDIRIISGNVLTGEKVSEKDYLGFYENVITVIPEGNKPEFMGWAKLGRDKFSISRTFFSWLNPNKERVIDTKLHGGERAYIVTGEMEKVFPMDIFPMQLLKAIHIKDLDLMEELGIYEIAEEDFALCEVINTSKIEIQKNIREGFEFAIKELG
ncbi:MAG: Na(+)-translocating NADH-quinone reductase subunit A [Chlorobi bacterium]|nr:Na(+)-translocating NADH-quinone reductase subunit A [Chlorobiota bacterium]